MSLLSIQWSENSCARIECLLMYVETSTPRSQPSMNAPCTPQVAKEQNVLHPNPVMLLFNPKRLNDKPSMTQQNSSFSEHGFWKTCLGFHTLQPPWMAKAAPQKGNISHHISATSTKPSIQFYQGTALGWFPIDLSKPRCKKMRKTRCIQTCMKHVWNGPHERMATHDRNCMDRSENVRKSRWKSHRVASCCNLRLFGQEARLQPAQDFVNVVHLVDSIWIRWKGCKLPKAANSLCDPTSRRSSCASRRFSGGFSRKRIALASHLARIQVVTRSGNFPSSLLAAKRRKLPVGRGLIEKLRSSIAKVEIKGCKKDLKRIFTAEVGDTMFLSVSPSVTSL